MGLTSDLNKMGQGCTACGCSMSGCGCLVFLVCLLLLLLAGLAVAAG